MSCRALILTEIISPYRIPVFNALAEKSGVDLKVIFLSETDPGLRQWRVYKNEIRFSYQVLPSWRRRFGKHSLLLNRGLSGSLKSFSPDVILCGGYNYLASWSALRWAKHNDVRFLLWTESTGTDARSGSVMSERLKRSFVSQCDGFVVPGASSRAYLKTFQVHDEEISIAPNAIDNQFFSSGARTAQNNAELLRRQLNLPSRYFLFVGRLVREKGVFDLLEAYAALSAGIRSQVGLVFVGDGGARAGLERIAELKQLDTVRFAGFVHREELPTYYGLADALVFPTYSDTWGLVVNEAMSCGLPVISNTAAGCVKDLVRDGWNGRLICPGETEQLSQAMEELASDEIKRIQMGERSRELIAAFSPESCAAGMAGALLSGKRTLQIA
jgi:glycosyltransferase involved in cell wall biosynthesis